MGNSLNLCCRTTIIGDQFIFDEENSRPCSLIDPKEYNTAALAHIRD